MLAALIALPMVFVWVAYVAAAAISLASGDPTRILVWLVATPFVFIGEFLGFSLLDRTAKFG